MTALLLALTLLSSPAPEPTRPGVEPFPPAASATATERSTGAVVVPPAPPLAQGLPETPSRPSTSLWMSALPAFSAVAALAGAALVFSRRRPRRGARMVEVLETAGLGPKRQLVVARMGDQLLLLASSEAGVSLLSTQPAPVTGHEPLAELDLAPVLPAPSTPAPVPAPAGIQGLWSRFRAPAAPAPSRSFEDLLQDTADDLELRRKLASGRPGRVA